MAFAAAPDPHRSRNYRFPIYSIFSPPSAPPPRTGRLVPYTWRAHARMSVWEVDEMSEQGQKVLREVAIRFKAQSWSQV
ncbi:hypothetical protein M3J09_013824 [Ascochyta lentis]